ncbi:hypothetical protein [Candidatus Regiella insecticola]
MNFELRQGGQRVKPMSIDIWLEQFNLIQGVGAKTVQIVRQATTTQDQIKLLQLYYVIQRALADNKAVT